MMTRRRRTEGPMWVVGSIDAYGAIMGRVIPEGDAGLHTPEEKAGHSWRWCLWSQDWPDFLGCHNLTREEIDLVEDWLERHGHKDYAE